MWLTIHTCRLQCDYSAKAALLVEAAGWVSKHPHSKDSTLNPGSSSLLLPLLVFFSFSFFSFSGFVPSNCRIDETSAARRGNYCVCVYSAFLCAPTHASTCPILLRAAHLSTPRNNFAESHGVIRKRGSHWLRGNTTRFLESPIHVSERRHAGPITGRGRWKDGGTKLMPHLSA